MYRTTFCTTGNDTGVWIVYEAKNARPVALWPSKGPFADYNGLWPEAPYFDFADVKGIVREAVSMEVAKGTRYPLSLLAKRPPKTIKASSVEVCPYSKWMYYFDDEGELTFRTRQPRQVFVKPQRREYLEYEMRSILQWLWPSQATP